MGGVQKNGKAIKAKGGIASAGGNRPTKNNKPKNNNKPVRKLYLWLGIAAVLVTGFFTVKGLIGGRGETTVTGGDLIIPKSDIGETARFYPYEAGGIKMEVLAVKAGDGTIRTAFNTCQVCYNSGRGYYKQEGDTLVCQNCGNVFRTDQVELIKGGCNPVPILEEDKADDGADITISEDFLTQNRGLFENWKR